MLFIGGFVAVLPTMVLIINNAYWLEWVVVGMFMIYMLLIGISALTKRQTINQTA